MIHTRYTPATSQYGSHMGTCYHFPASAEAWTERAHVEISSETYPGLEPAQLIDKAVAILRNQIAC